MMHLMFVLKEIYNIHIMWRALGHVLHDANDELFSILQRDLNF